MCGVYVCVFVYLSVFVCGVCVSLSVFAGVGAKLTTINNEEMTRSGFMYSMMEDGTVLSQ